MSEKENKKPEKQAAAAAPAPREVKPKPSSNKPHHIKVTQMSSSEIDAALEMAKKHMGGFTSHYAQALLARREVLRMNEPAFKLKAA